LTQKATKGSAASRFDLKTSHYGATKRPGGVGITTVNLSKTGGSASDHEDAKTYTAVVNLLIQEALESAQRPGGKLWKAGQK
jgi:hypothetical protein